MSAIARRKLIEVALPLEAINAACRADKNRKTGTVRNLHKWFAPMPLPAWRALLFASVLDAPSDEQERQELHRLIERLCPADRSAPAAPVVAEARRRIRETIGSDLPTVLDPFCGAGTTVVEAQRLGLPAVASDLNPVPVLITRFLTSTLPRVAGHPALHAPNLLSDSDDLASFTADVKFYAQRVYEMAFERIGDHYPAAPNGDRVIAWRWARTVASPDPRFRRAQTPLVGDWWLSKKDGLRAFVSPQVDVHERRVRFEIEHDPNATPPSPSKDRCLLSGVPISFDYLREQGKTHGFGLALLAVISHGDHGRAHFAPTTEHVEAASDLPEVALPDAPLPERGLGFRIQQYGLKSWMDLFTPRQRLALHTFASLVAEVPRWVTDDGGDEDYARAITEALGLCVGKLASFSSTQSLWRLDSRNGSGKAEAAFGRAVLPMTFDFVETNPFGGSVGDWLQLVETASRSFASAVVDGPPAEVAQRDARSANDLVSGEALVATDPPYFDQIGYSDLSDFFYLWLREALKGIDRELFSTIVTPKAAELISDPARHDGSEESSKDYFIRGFTETFSRLRERIGKFPLLVVYAFRQQEGREGSQTSTGWEAMLEAVLDGGLAVTGTWPIHGTGTTRQRAQASNALATYVVLVCRERSAGAPLATRREFHRELRDALAPAVADLQSASIAPVDLAQAAIGPGMAVFSRYSKVIEADGSPMRVRAALGLINEVLDSLLAEQEADFDADTRWCVAWFEQHGMQEGAFGVADALSRAKNTAVNGLVEAGVLHSRAGKVRLLDRGELAEDWDPAEDRRLTVWEVTQHLIARHENGGESAAAALLRRVGGGLAEAARELAYRLYAISERKGWAQEALAYNALVVAWPEIARLAAQTDQVETGQQEAMEV